MRRIVPVLLVAVVAAACNSGGTSESTTSTTVGPGTTSTTTTTGPTTTTAPGVPFVVATILPITGNLADIGLGMERAAVLASEQLAAAGGIPGFVLDLASLDGSTVAAARAAAEEAAADDGVVAVIGGASIETTAALLGPITARGVPVVTPSVMALLPDMDDGSGLLVRVRPDPSLEGVALAGLVAAGSHRRVVVVFDRAAATVAVADRLVETLEGIDTESYGLPLDVADLVDILEGQPADAIVCVCRAGPEADELISGAADRGLLDIPWYFGSGMLDPTLPGRVLGGDPGGLTGFAGVVAASPRGPAHDAFVAAYEERFGDPPGAFAAETYDAAWLVILAAAAVGPGGDLRTAMTAVSAGGTSCSGAGCLEPVVAGEDVDYVGASGGVDLGADGAPGTAEYRTWRFTPTGGIEFLDE